METVKPEIAKLAQEQMANLKAQAMGQADDGLRDFVEFEQQQAQEEPTTPKAESEGESTEGEPELAELLERLDRLERDRSRKAGEADYWRKEVEKIRNQAQEPVEQPQTQQDFKPFRARPEDLDNYMSKYDPEWDTKKADDIYRESAQIAYDTTVNGVMAVAQELQTLRALVSEMQFGSQLNELGIDRGVFKEIVSDPRMAWMQKLSSQEQLEAIAQMRGLSGGRPSQATAQEPSAAGAHTTPRARHHVEVGMGADNFQDPVTRSLSDLRSAHEKGDMGAARKAARPLWEQFLRNG